MMGKCQRCGKEIGSNGVVGCIELSARLRIVGKPDEPIYEVSGQFCQPCAILLNDKIKAVLDGSD